MNRDLALLPPERRDVVHDDGSQTWTTTWTLTVTRAPAPALYAQPTEPVVLTPMPVPPRATYAPVAPAAPRPLPSRRELHGRDVAVRTPRLPPRTAPRTPPPAARRPAPARTARPPAPAFLRVSLGVAIGAALVVAGIRAHALDGLGLRPTDNASVAAAVTRFIDHATGD